MHHQRRPMTSTTMENITMENITITKATNKKHSTRVTDVDIARPISTSIALFTDQLFDPIDLFW